MEFDPYRLDLAKEIIQIRARHQLVPDPLGAAKLDRLYEGRVIGFSGWALTPKAVNIPVPLGASSIDAVE
jgi:hypothetical protein